jgi:hypothetical protein
MFTQCAVDYNVKTFVGTFHFHIKLHVIWLLKANIWASSPASLYRYAAH